MEKGAEQGQTYGGTDGGGDGYFNRGKEESRPKRGCSMFSTSLPRT